MTIIKVHNVLKRYTQGTKVIHAVDHVSIDIPQGEFLAIIGASGSGKSTFLQLVGGLDRPTSGTVEINGKDIGHMSDMKLTALRRNTIGFVFQSFNLIPTLTAEQNVEAGIAKRTSHDRKRVREALKQVGLLDRAHHLPSLLSGGEQQRVAIARALINEPEIILADEPTGNLDSRTGEEIVNMLRDLNKAHGKTVILITHSDYIKKYAHRVMEMKDGTMHELSRS
ncbi:MAG: ABC transporter ATP-binding protein [Patescibacteria group bacterium]|jgi:putative ABC transport system ATP-binding protein